MKSYFPRHQRDKRENFMSPLPHLFTSSFIHRQHELQKKNSSPFSAVIFNVTKDTNIPFPSNFFFSSLSLLT
jgi:hypothetical protein